jgi:hypothetical protein
MPDFGARNRGGEEKKPAKKMPAAGQNESDGGAYYARKVGSEIDLKIGRPPHEMKARDAN